MKRKEMYLILTVVLLISAAANGFVRDDFNQAATIILSVLGSICLAVTIYLYAKQAQ